MLEINNRMCMVEARPPQQKKKKKKTLRGRAAFQPEFPFDSAMSYFHKDFIRIRVSVSM